MFQLVAEAGFLAVGGGALALISHTIASEFDAISGALRGAVPALPARREWPSRVRLVSMPVSRPGFRQPMRAHA